MVAHRKRWWAWIALLPALLTTDVRAAETSVSLSLDYEIDGRAAPFLLPFDKGYYKAEGLNVAIEPASSNCAASWASGTSSATAPSRTSTDSPAASARAWRWR